MRGTHRGIEAFSIQHTRCTLILLKVVRRAAKLTHVSSRKPDRISRIDIILKLLQPDNVSLYL